MGNYEYKSYAKNVLTDRQLAYECKKGFRLNGPVGSTCLNGEWHPSELPKCIPYNYPALISFQNRKRRSIDTIRSDNFNQNSNNKNQSTCILSVTNSYRVQPKPYKTLSSGLIYLHGSRVSVNCIDGYLQTLDSDNFNQTAICLDGYWRPMAPICKESKCLLNRRVENALYFSNDHNLLTPNSTLNHDQIAFIKCLPDYVLKGANAIRCYLGELSTVYVHDVHLKNACLNCDRKEDEIIDWPICVKKKNPISTTMVSDWSLEKKQIELMIKDDLDEIKKLNKTSKDKSSYSYLDSWCDKPTILIKSLLKHIDRLKNINQLKSKLIGIVELDHHSKKTYLTSSFKKKLIYPPGSQLLYQCINDDSNWIFNNVLIKNLTNHFKQMKSSWLLTCSKGAWIGKRIPCIEREFDDLI